MSLSLNFKKLLTLGLYNFSGNQPIEIAYNVHF